MRTVTLRDPCPHASVTAATIAAEHPPGPAPALRRATGYVGFGCLTCATKPASASALSVASDP